MGVAALKKKAKKAELLQHLLQQEDPDVIQLPLQEDDGWFRGCTGKYLPVALDVWKKHGGDRELWVYRIDKFWVKQCWETKGGNKIERGDLILEIHINEFAKELWLNTVTQPQFKDEFAIQIEAVKRGESGCVQFWWLKRFLMCRAVAEKPPVNYWEYFPIVEVYRPDGSYEQSAVDVTTFLNTSNKSFSQDPKGIESAAPWEKRVFDACIKCEVL